MPLFGTPTSRCSTTGHHILRARAYIHRRSGRRRSRIKFHCSLKTAPEKSLGTRISVTRRPYIPAEIEGCLAERVISVFVGPSKEYITRYLRAIPGEKMDPNAMDGPYKLWKEKFWGKMPESISEMWAGGTVLIIPL